MRSILLTILLLAVSACATAEDSDARDRSTPVALHACQTTVPVDWQRALDDSGVAAESYPMTTGPAGELVARRGGDLIVIHPDRTISTAYTVPDPAGEALEIAAINDRWIVVGIRRTEGNTVVDGEILGSALGVLKRIDLVDRRDDSVRTVVATPEADLRVGRDAIDSLAVFDDSVYWITRDEYSGDHGTLRSYDAVTGDTADVESADMRDLRATATGIVWTSNHPEPHTVFRSLKPLPDALTSITGINDDQTSLVRDGDAYAWITGVAEGGTGIARWSPDGGLTRISTLTLADGGPVEQPPLHLTGPYVVVGAAGNAVVSTLVDTRSGAVTPLGPAFGAAGGSITVELSDASGTRPPAAGLVRTDQLPPLSCGSTESQGATTRPSCEVALPARWREAFADSAIDTGGTTEPLAAGPGGAIAAGYDDGDTRRLLLIDADGTVKTVYRVTDPGVEKVGFAFLDERHVVVGVESSARRTSDGRPHLDDDDRLTATNSPPPTLTRIDVVDRSNNSVRTVMALTAEDRANRSGYRDFLAVSDGTVYWTAAAGDRAHTVVRSYDLDTGDVAEIAKADYISELRATAVGVTWEEGNQGPNRKSHHVTELPAAILSAGADPDETLVTDGTAYAWITDTGITHWAPDTGMTRVDTIRLSRDSGQGLHVDGPYVIIGGFMRGGTEGTVIDTRSGAVSSLDARVATTGGGTVAVRVPESDYAAPQAGLIRLADLPPLTCGG